MNANGLLFQFAEHLKTLGRTADTVEAYTSHTRLFLAGVAKDIKAMTRRDLEAYIAGLFEYRTEEGKAYATGTVGIKVRSLKRFVSFRQACIAQKKNVIHT